MGELIIGLAVIVILAVGAWEAWRRREKVDVAVEIATAIPPVGSDYDGTVVRVTAKNIGRDPVAIEAMSLRLGTGKSVTFIEEMPNNIVPTLLAPGQSTSMWMAQEPLEGTLRLQGTHLVGAEVYGSGGRRWDSHDLGRFSRLGS